jgi:hypothetical protein
MTQRIKTIADLALRATVLIGGAWFYGYIMLTTLSAVYG